MYLSLGKHIVRCPCLKLETSGKASWGNNSPAKKTPLMSHVWLRKGGDEVGVRKSISNKESSKHKSPETKESFRRIEKSLMRIERGEQGSDTHEVGQGREKGTRSWKSSDPSPGLWDFTLKALWRVVIDKWPDRYWLTCGAWVGLNNQTVQRGLLICYSSSWAKGDLQSRFGWYLRE